MRIIIKKAVNDISWTVILVLILTSGLTSWIVVPSISSSLQKGLGNYANSAATYVVVYGSIQPGQRQSYLFPAGFVSSVESLQGVEHVYLVHYNFTAFLMKINVCQIGGGGCMNATGFEETESAFIGGINGYPTSLINLTSGHMPSENESSFINNNAALGIFSDFNKQYEVAFNVSIHSTANSTNIVKFKASVGGINVLNPITGSIMVLWNREFLEHKLGEKLFNQTFGGGPNFIIVKAEDIQYVNGIARAIRNLLNNNTGYVVNYDEVALDAFRALETQSAPLYNLLTFVAIAVTSFVVFLVSYIAALKRKWEPALLITQGWTWKRYSRFLLSYFMLIGIISFVLSSIASYAITQFLHYKVLVSETYLDIGVQANLFYLISALPLVLMISYFSSFLFTKRVKSLGLDSLLREY